MITLGLGNHHPRHRWPSDENFPTTRQTVGSTCWPSHFRNLSCTQRNVKSDLLNVHPSKWPHLWHILVPGLTFGINDLHLKTCYTALDPEVGPECPEYFWMSQDVPSFGPNFVLRPSRSGSRKVFEALEAWVSHCHQAWYSCHKKNAPNLWLMIPYDSIAIPSGKHTKSYWKWPFIVSFPIKNCDFP